MARSLVNETRRSQLASELYQGLGRCHQNLTGQSVWQKYFTRRQYISVRVGRHSCNLILPLLMLYLPCQISLAGNGYPRNSLEECCLSAEHYVKIHPLSFPRVSLLFVFLRLFCVSFLLPLSLLPSCFLNFCLCLCCISPFAMSLSSLPFAFCFAFAFQFPFAVRFPLSLSPLFPCFGFVFLDFHLCPCDLLYLFSFLSDRCPLPQRQETTTGNLYRDRHFTPRVI